MRRFLLAALLAALIPSSAHAERTGYCWDDLGCARIFYEIINPAAGLYQFTLENDPGVGLWAFYFMGVTRDWAPPEGVVDDYRLEFVGDGLGWYVSPRAGTSFGIDRDTPLAGGTWFMQDPFVRDYGAPLWNTSKASTHFEAGAVPLPPRGLPTTVTPEPATFALLALGLFGVGYAARRQRRHQ